MAEQPESVDFEASLGELEALVAKMEDGSLTLEESLQAFERGVKLSRACQQALRNAELRIKALTQDGDQVDLSTAGDENVAQSSPQGASASRRG